MAPPAVPKRATLFSPSYRSRRVLHIRFSCQVPCSFPLGFSSGSSPALQLFCGFASLWYCFLSVKSHINGQQLWLGVLFHLHWPPLVVFGVSFHFSRNQIKSSNLKKKSLLMHKEIKIKIHETNAFIYGNYKFKGSFSSHGCFAIFPASSVVQLRIPIGILNL